MSLPLPPLTLSLPAPAYTSTAILMLLLTVIVSAPSLPLTTIRPVGENVPADEPLKVTVIG